MSSPSETSMIRVHVGRGGAGNVVKSSSLEARRASRGDTGPSEVTGRRFSTGIGGTGNMAKNLDQEETRTLLDVKAPGLVLADSYGAHTGIGGSANVYRPTESEIDTAKINNEHVRRQSLAYTERRRQSMISMNEDEGSRRPSVVENVRDFLGRRNSKSPN